MYIKQLSVFVENKNGRLAEIVDILSANNINLHALSIADTSDFGVLRLIVDEPNKAVEVLKNEGLVVKLSDVLAISIDDKPGSLANLLKMIQDNDVAIEYMYAFVGRVADKALMVLRVSDNEKVIKVLEQNNVAFVTGEEFYK